MRRFFILPLVAVSLSACAQFPHTSADSHQMGEKKYSRESGVDNSTAVEVRVLKDKIRQVLGVPNAAAVVVPAFQGKTVLFKQPEDKARPTFPFKTPQVLNMVGITWLEFEGSCAGYILTSTGYRIKVTLPPEIAEQFGLTCN